MATLITLLILSLAATLVESWRPWADKKASIYDTSKKFEGSSSYVNMTYHNGPVLSDNITIYPLWYGNWTVPQKLIIKDFILSISEMPPRRPSRTPSVRQWWKTVQTYTDDTGAHVTNNVKLGKEFRDKYSHGKSLTRVSMESILKSAVTAKRRPLPVDPKGGVYLLLTSGDVQMDEFCRAVCGFHHYAFVNGKSLPFAWVGNSEKQCPGTCAYPFAIPPFLVGSGSSFKAFTSTNGDVGVEGMISVIGHELAELASNPLGNAWYAGDEPTAPVEIADLCEGIYGTGGGGAYTGQVVTDGQGRSFNLNGVGTRRYLVQWVWSQRLKSCYGPNSLDH